MENPKIQSLQFLIQRSEWNVIKRIKWADKQIKQAQGL